MPATITTAMKIRAYGNAMRIVAFRSANGSGALLGAGGRVLAVTALGETLAEAKARAYMGVDAIDYADGFHRRDIGWRELERVT